MIEIINELLDTSRFFLLLYVLFAEKIIRNRKRLALMAMVYVVIFAGLLCLGMEEDLYLLGTLAQIAMVALLLREKWYERILSFLVLFSLPDAAEVSLEIIYKYIIGADPFQGILELDYGMIGRLMSLLLILLIGYLRRRKRIKIYISNTSKFLLFVIIVSFLITLTWMTNGEYRSDKISVLLMSICCMIIVFISIWILIIDSSRKKQAVNAERTEQYLSYIERLQTAQEEIRKIHHDLKRHLSTLNYYADDKNVDGIKDYLRSMSDDLADRYEDVYYTENHLFNAILEDKKKRAEKADIAIQFNGTLGRDINIDDYDLTIIFSNLLDNAIEYVSQNDFKTIDIDVFQDQNSIIIRVANRIKEEEDVQIGKSDKAHTDLHGFGLMNVKRAAEKYNGMLELNVEDGWFAAKVLIMN